MTEKIPIDFERALKHAKMVSKYNNGPEYSNLFKSYIQLYKLFKSHQKALRKAEKIISKELYE